MIICSDADYLMLHCDSAVNFFAVWTRMALVAYLVLAGDLWAELAAPQRMGFGAAVYVLVIGSRFSGLAAVMAVKF